MVIYLKHPKHGTKVAISDAEANADMRNGWERFDPADDIEQKDEQVSNTLRLKRPYNRRTA